MRMSLGVGLVFCCVFVAVAAPLAGAVGPREHFTGSTESRPDMLGVSTAGCSDFVTPQPYPDRMGSNFRMNASWKYSMVRQDPVWIDVRGKMTGDGVDLNTGLTYSLDGKFAADQFYLDILASGDFTIARSDGAEMDFRAWFQIGGAGAPALLVDASSVVCTPPKQV